MTEKLGGKRAQVVAGDEGKVVVVGGAAAAGRNLNNKGGFTVRLFCNPYLEKHFDLVPPDRNSSGLHFPSRCTTF